VEKKCGYYHCGKPLKEGSEVKNTIHYRSGAQLARKEKEYCSKQCASHDQMAHEG